MESGLLESGDKTIGDKSLDLKSIIISIDFEVDYV